MKNEELIKAFQEQAAFEFYSAYLYFSMANWATLNHWNGFATWLRHQAKEEAEHAKAFNKHLLERGAEAKLLAIPEPKSTWTDLENVFVEVFEHEKQVTERIHQMTQLAKKAEDNIAFKFLVAFEEEQVEEENSTEEILVAIQRIGKNQGLLYSLDGKVGARA